MKKTIYKAFAMAGLLFLVVVVNACLKDDSRFTDFTTVGNTIQFLDQTPGKATALNIVATSPDDDTVTVRVSQSGPQATSVDLAVTIATSQAGLDLYNQDKGHVVGTALPTTAYTFPTTVTIKAGKDPLGNNNRTISFPLLIHQNQVPQTPGVNYVLALAITAVSPSTTISANQGFIMFNFYHNSFDGDYTVTGSMVDVTTAALTEKSPMQMKLITINATDSYAFSYDIGQPAHPILSSGSLSYYGNMAMQFTFDETAGAVVNVVNWLVDPAPRNRTLKLVADPASNTWDGTTKTMKVHYKMVQDDIGDRTTFTEVWVHN